MHEVSLIQSINEAVMAEMPKHNITKIESITLRIGEMRQVIPDTLIFAFEILSKDTPLEGAKLIVENIPTKSYTDILPPLNSEEPKKSAGERRN